MKWGEDDDTLIPLREATKSLPPRRMGKRPNVSCLHRWASKGIAGVRLRITSVGATRCTTRRWLAEFFDQVAAARAGSRGIAIADPRPVNQSAVDAALDLEGL